jgi:hypothetical protein
MKTAYVKRTRNLFLFLMLTLGAYPLLFAQTPVITVKGTEITMSNEAGCKLVFYHDRENGRYGLGTISYNGVPMGQPVKYFLSEDNIFESSRMVPNRLYPGTWQPYFQADTFKILSNTPESGVIRFTGEMGKIIGSVTISLARNSKAYELDYSLAFDKSIKHSLYVSVPFMNEKMQFVQFPFETPLSPPFTSHWSMTPTLSVVPMMWGCQQINQQDYYLGVAYKLMKDDYQRGKISYDATKESPFRIYFIPPTNSGWFPTHRMGTGGEKRVAPDSTKLHIVISTADNQYDCVMAYKNVSGYDVSTPIYRTVDDAVARVMNMYEKTSAYVALPPYKNSGYHHQIVPQTGKAPTFGYGRWINIGVNAQLGYQLYKYWQENPRAEWARDRALNLAGFYMEVQKEDGSVPSLWDPYNKVFRSYTQKNTEEGYIYTMDRQAFGAFGLYRMYLARKESENVAAEEMKSSALKAMDFIADKVNNNGILGRVYNAAGDYDAVAPPNEVLIALDYFYNQTGNRKYDQAREILEKHTFETHVYKNHWRDWSSDWGFWRGNEQPPWNIETLNALSFATYCAYRHKTTGDPKYIEWARHLISYIWLTTVPIQYPGFKHVTKGLTREQDNYTSYDVPYRCTILIDCLPYLSRVTRDRFFMDFFKMQLQTQHAYQHPEESGLQSFDIGLWWDASGGAEPVDEIAEPGINYISEFCSMYLESVTSPNTYRYVGGTDWGVGLDYDLPFTPNSGENGLFVAAATSSVTAATWDAKHKTLTVVLQAKSGRKGELFILGPAGKTIVNCKVKVEGKDLEKNNLKYSSRQNMLTIDYAHLKSMVTVQISMR